VKIDFSKFKKIECGDKCTTLQHESGHQLKIAHKSLSPENRKELDELPIHMAKGGKAKFSQKYDPNIGQKGYKQTPGKGVGREASGASGPSKSSNTMPGSPMEAKDAYTEPNDQGASIGPVALYKELKRHTNPVPSTGHSSEKELKKWVKSGLPCLNSACKSYGHAHPNCQCYGYGNFADGGRVDDQYFCDANREHFKGCEYARGGEVQKFATKGDVESDSDKLQQASQEIQSEDPENQATSSNSELDPTSQGYGANTLPPPAPSPAPATDQQPQQDQSVNPNTEMASNNQQVQGNQEQADVPDQDQSSPETGPIDSIGPVRSPAQHAQAVSNYMLDHDQKMKQDLDNGWITPKTYADIMPQGTLGKIGTIFGMMLGGMGSGLTHQPNAFLQMMNNTIQNDLNAQEASATNRQTLKRIAQQGILNDANARSININADVASQGLKNMMANRIALDHVAKLGDKLSGQDLIKHNMMLTQLAPMVDKENATIASKVALASAMTQMAHPQGGAGGSGRPDTAFMESFGSPQMQEYGHQIDQRSLPGESSVAGQTSTKPLEKNDSDRIQAMNTLDKQAKYLRQFAGKNWGTLDPKTRASALQQAHELVSYYGSSLGINPTEGGRTWLDDQVARKNPTSALGQLFGSQDKLEEIIRSNQVRKNSLLNHMGFTVDPQEGVVHVNKKTGQRGMIKNGKWTQM
jgi:hypothetical protein